MAQRHGILEKRLVYNTNKNELIHALGSQERMQLLEVWLLKTIILFRV